MSRASRLARLPSSPPPRKETIGPGGGGRRPPRVLSVGEKLMKAGNDGTLAKQKPPVPAATATTPAEDKPAEMSTPGENTERPPAAPKSRISPPKPSALERSASQKQAKGNLKVTSPEDTEHLSRKQGSPNGTQPSKGDPKGCRSAPRRHTVGGARSSKEILAMQPPDMDKKREAFLEHLKQKYPHHASAIMGHQVRLKEQSSRAMLSSLHSELDIQSYMMKIKSRSPKHSVSPQPGVGDQTDHLASLESLNTMSEADAPSAFTRGSRIRASLPVVRSANQTKDRSLGVLYLQYGDETKQIRMPNEITSTDTVRALFVSAFPQQLTMKMLESPSVAVYVKDDMRNMYYELTDVRNITDHSCLKVYHKDPAQAFIQGPRPSNGDPRMSREMMYASREGREGPPPFRQPLVGPLLPHHPMSPPPPHPMPPSPSRIPFGGRQGSAGGGVSRERLASAPVRSTSPCPSAILERRDVKPDEDVVGAKSHTLSRGSEGMYADPYLLQEARLNMAAAAVPHGPHPPGPGLDGPDHGLAGYHRASIRSSGSYGGPSPTDTMEHPSLYRQKSGRNSQLPTLGSKTPPPSPHRMTEVRMIDVHNIPPHAVPLERCSPVRQSFRKEETGAKPRNNMADSQGPNPNSPQTRERMMAMEQQIASLTGLVQHALLKGPNSSGAKEPPSERPLKTSSPAHSLHSAGSGGSPVLAARSSTVLGERSLAPLQVNLLHFRKNVADLRQQLQQMKQLQLQNQEALRGQMKRVEQEISVKLAEAMRCMEDPVQMQRALVDQDRHKYLGLEERVLAQLSELERYVESLKKESPGPRRTVTLKDVEEGAVNLRKVGESLAGLKGEFPALQTRMRAVLRVEVEAVKFLKEEPHKLDSMLKRVKSLTDTLGCLRRCATEDCSNTSSKLASVDSSTAVVAPPPAESPAPLAPLSPTAGPQSSSVRSEVMPSSPVVIHHVQSSPVLMQQSQQSEALQAQPSPPLTPGPNGHGVLPTSPKGAVTSDSPSPVRHKKAPPIPVNSPSQDLVIEELQSSRSKSKNRALSIEAAEKEWEEKRQNLGHYDGKEFERILQEAQANMMKGLSNLDVEGNPVATGDQTDNRSPTGSPTEPQTEWCPESPANPTETEKLAEKPAKATEKSNRAPLERSVKTCVTGPAPSDKVTKQGSEKANRSPPPPPPRKTYPSSSSSGMTTTHSGEVVYTARKESASTVEGSEETPPLSPTAKPAKVPPETKPKSSTPPPVTSSVVREEEDEGDKIMAQLQAFQKCSVKDVGGKGLVELPSRIEPQIRELRPGALLPIKEKKSSELSREDKEQDIDENGNTTVRQSPGVIYYVTGQISKDLPTPSEIEDTHEHREPTLVPSQVSNVNANDNSPSQQKQQQPLSKPPLSHPPFSPPPISPKPPGLNGFKLPRKQMKRSVSLKTSAEAEKGNIILNQINTEKKLKSSIKKEQVSPSIIPTVKSTVSTVRDEPKTGVSHAEEAPCERNDQSGDKCESGNDEASLSPDLPGEEAPPPPDNIAFMITKTMVQALSCGEYQELVNAQKDGVQTVTVCKGGNRNNTTGNFLVDSPAVPDNGLNKKPVIIIFDEPMDIRSAYKRLSTVFECEEEMDRMLAEECIDEESEESDMDKSGGVHEVTPKVSGSLGSSLAHADRGSLSSSSSSSLSEVTEGGTNVESSGDAKQESKKRFKFKFPKKQLAALTQAIRTGTKSGKKTLQVVVYEDEEESDGTLRQHKEAKRFEIVRNKASADTPKDSITEKRDTSDSLCRTDKIRKSTYKTLDSLEQTIKQLETTISEMGPPPVEEPVCPEEANVGETSSSVTGGLRRSVSLPTSKGPATKVLPPSKSSLRKTKPQLLPRPVVVPTTITTTAPTVPSTIQQNASVASPTSRMPVPLSAKSRQSPGTTDKTGKQQKLQDAQRQFRQANGSAKRMGGDHKSSSPSVPVSKIPAFYPSSTKASTQSTPDAANSINPSSSSSSSSSSCSSSTTTKSSLPSPHAPRSSSAPNPSSHIPSLSNGSHKLPAPSQHSVKALLFSSQTQNGRAHSFSSSSSSTPSPLSPTPLGPGGKSIRTIHTPSFTSYRPHNGSAAKSCIPTATAAKDSA